MNDKPINPGSNLEADAPNQAGNIRWRHGKNDQANFLFADGTVRTLNITRRFTDTNYVDAAGDCLYKLWRIKAPAGYLRSN